MSNPTLTLDQTIADSVKQHISATVADALSSDKVMASLVAAAMQPCSHRRRGGGTVRGDSRAPTAPRRPAIRGGRMTIAPPFPYSGGKQSIAADIAALFPPHGHYIEPFCGGLSVLLAKTPSPQKENEQ